MTTRREILTGTGIAMGTIMLPLAAAGRRNRAGSWVYEPGVPGPDVPGTFGPAPATVSDSPTQLQIEGPFYTPKTPRRRDRELFA